MKINLKNGESTSFTKKFPMNVFDIQDTLDRLKIPDDKPIVQFEISEHDNMEFPFALCLRNFSADIYRLNLFAERLENLGFSEMTAFRSLLKANLESSFEDILKMTYWLDSVIIYPCSDCRELGETVIENEMMPELESCSDEILELLDREKVGRLMQEREGGVFINEHYCVTSGYEPPDINIEIGRPENCFFRLLIVPKEEKIDQAQWISLPCEKEITSDFYNGICLDFQSALPNLKFDDTHKIGTLNELAVQILQLSHDDFVKLKAVMESEKIHEISDAIECISRLDEYQFDRNIPDQSEFGRNYLALNLPANFNNSILENADLFDFGQEVLAHKQGEITSYGAISGRGQELYSALTIQSEQQLDEEVEEDFELEIGGMSL
ncbi:MAG: hypothetical protein NC235_12455 [Clostridiales bacterium]|nr:hypothetical protein [Clostridiales bacterium]